MVGAYSGLILTTRFFPDVICLFPFFVFMLFISPSYGQFFALVLTEFIYWL